MRQPLVAAAMGLSAIVLVLAPAWAQDAKQSTGSTTAAGTESPAPSAQPADEVETKTPSADAEAPSTPGEPVAPGTLTPVEGEASPAGAKAPRERPSREAPAAEGEQEMAATGLDLALLYAVSGSLVVLGIAMYALARRAARARAV